MSHARPAAARQLGAVGLGVLALHTAVLWRVPIAPFRKYSVAAERLASGQMDAERLLDFSPLYLRFHMLLAEISAQPERLAVALQVLMVSAAAMAFYSLLRRYVTPRWATVAVIAFALDRHLLVYERVLEPEAVIVAALVGLLSLLVGVSRPCAPRVAVVGGLAALCVTARPTFLVLFMVLVPLHLWLGDPRLREWLKRCAVFAAPMVLALLAVAWHSRDAADPSAPVMNPGTVFFEGHQPLSRGTSAQYPPTVWLLQHDPAGDPDVAHSHYRRVARADAGEPLSASQVNAFWARRGVNYLLDAPMVSLRRAARQLRYAGHSFRWHDLPAARLYDRALPVPGLPFSLVASLALFGVLYTLPRWRHLLLLYGVAAGQLAVLLVFYVSARQRLPLLPVVYFFAALALERWTSADAPARWRLHALLAALLTVALMLPDDIMVDEAHRRRSSETAGALFVPIRERGELHLARHVDAVVEALAAAPWWLDDLYPSHMPHPATGTLAERVTHRVRQRYDSDPTPSLGFDLAALELRLGRYDRAIELLEPLVADGFLAYRGSRQPSDPRILLSTALAETGRVESAEALLEEVLSDSPGDLFAACELAMIQDREPEATLGRWWSTLDIDATCGQTALRHRRFERAETYLTRVVERLPALRPAQIGLAVALGGQGRIDEAVERYLVANAMRTDPIQHGDAIVEIIEAWLARHPDDPDIRWTSARILAQHGRFQRALDVFAELPEALRQRAEPWRRQIAEAAALTE